MNTLMTISLFIGLLLLIRGAYLDHKAYYCTLYSSHFDDPGSKYWYVATVLIMIPMIYWAEL